MIAHLSEKKPLNSDTVQFTFKLSESFTFDAGQYVFVELSHLLKEDDRGPRRHFSVVNSPTISDSVTITTRIRESGYKQTLNSLAIHEDVEIIGPYGDFGITESEKNYIFIAGGIGITPFMSMLRAVEEKLTPVDSITMFYSNTDRSRTAYLKELEQFVITIPNFKLIAIMTRDDSWSGEKERINGEMIKKYVSDISQPFYYVVGPEAMNESVSEELEKLGVLENKIKREDFTGY